MSRCGNARLLAVPVWLLAASLLSSCRPELNNENGPGNFPVIDPSSVTLMVGNSKSFGIVEGTATLPVTWEILSGTGTIEATTGLYTAPGSDGNDIIQVTDAHGFKGTALVTINGGLSITAATDTTPNLFQNETHTYAAEGGVSPYTWSVTTGTGTISSAGVYTGPAEPLMETVTVTDSLGNTATASLYAMGNPEVFLRASDLNGNGDGNSGWTDSDAVTNWTDTRGGASVSQADAGKKPTYVAADSDTNNLPSVSFDGGDCMTFDTDFHDETFGYGFFYVGIGSSNQEYAYYNGQASGGYHYIGSNGGHGVAGSADDDPDGMNAAVASLIPSLHISAFFTSGQSVAYWGNGTTASQQNTDYDPFDASDGTTGVLGSNSTTCASNNWTGKIAEVIYYQANMTTAAGKAISCYFASQYGVTLAFSSDCL